MTPLPGSRFPRNIARDGSGSVAIEFALIAPALIAMLLGIFQVGVGMQNYNAMRSISADVARYAVVCYQKQDTACNDDTEFETWARRRAAASPYNLDRERLTVDVQAVDPSTVAGALEKTITLTYAVPSVMGLVGLQDISLDYTRPVFLVA